MRPNSSLVSAIIIFLNAEKFIEEAIESILAQTYNNWELLLVDDGSTDASTTIAQQYAARNPEKIRYLEHNDHQNRGMSASRNLGIAMAQGTYVAFLDADDLWLPQKLEKQVAILEDRPDVGMVYSNTRYWYSWTGRPEDQGRDSMPEMGIQAHTVVKAPALLPLYLRGRAAVPCTCGLMVRRDVLKRIGGFEDYFRGMYEDQAFYAKICLRESVYVFDDCLDWYRQHADSNCNVAAATGVALADRLRFLKWLSSYMAREGINHNEVWLALEEQLWLQQQPAWLPDTKPTRQLVRRVKKWLLRLNSVLALPRPNRRIN